MPLRFLTARWSHLAMLQFAVPEAWFARYLPPDCVPDTSLDGRAYCSLVGFDFLDCRVLGVPWPGFRNFPEFNLRLYVRHVPTGDRGVVFVRELVPSRFVAAVARWTYNEPYLAVPMSSSVEVRERRISVEHRVTFAGKVNRLRVLAGTPCALPPEGGTEVFFKEHRWGFNRSHGGRLIRYEVRHPHWKTFPVESYELEWDFEGLYGQPFAALAGRRPDSVLLAEGSDVSVLLWRPIRGS
jgi:uncharacterized protein YqjF (DUF2071 family)